jgi:uncharacterized protein (TIGR03089 family)
MSPHADAAEDFAALLERRVARDGDSPLVTWYGGSGDQAERVELSWRTFANWVAKTANLLVEELGVEPGDRVAVLLPPHWQAPVVLTACWLVGAAAVLAGPAAGPDERRRALLAGAGCRVAFVHERLLTVPLPADAAPPALVAITADLLGRGAGDLGGALPFSRAVAAMPDHFDAGGGRRASEALLTAEDGGRSRSQGELLEEAARLGELLGVTGADRLYSALGLDTATGVSAGLALPLAAGVGVVLEQASRPDWLWRRLAEERVTLALLPPERAEVLAAAAPPDGLDLSRLRSVRSSASF